MNDQRREIDNSAWYVQGLRNRFQPRSRLGQGLVSAAPWADICLLLILVVLLKTSLLLQPGVVVQMPLAGFNDGSPSAGEWLVIQSRRDVQEGTTQEIVVFRDQPYSVDTDMPRLQTALAGHAEAQENVALIIAAGEEVRHGTIVRILDMATRAGVRSVNLATRSDGGQ